ncbi:MAG: hypothetical protein NC408_07845 [Candidatus Gastranaerophilales bacterium]|nr:hypothetical protein [Candidatus Gastranaerophilales bacterium]MCM1072593.1 hypothetical protein [Bacteroides sp.]
MIKVYIPTDFEFKKYEDELRVLYEKNQEKICDTNSFDFIRDNTLFYMFVNNDSLIGAIYYFMDNDLLFLNGFAKPKGHSLNLRCLLISLSWFNTDIYAEAQNRASALCLLKCGFKRVKDKLFVFKQIGNY